MVSSLRQKLSKIHFLRSSYYLWRAWGERLHWANETTLRNWLEESYQHPDPWNYSGSRDEADRFQSAAQMLDAVLEQRKFGRAFEVGCAEGIFTRVLAARCERLLAVDLSEAALQRADKHCAGFPVEFETWDLRHSPAPSGMDLVIVMDVLELFYRPSDIERARDKLAAVVKPGGYLLLGNSRQNPIYETAWWGRLMLRGGKQISDLFGRHPRLELVSTECGTIYINSLFRAK